MLITSSVLVLVALANVSPAPFCVSSAAVSTNQASRSAEKHTSGSFQPRFILKRASGTVSEIEEATKSVSESGSENDVKAALSHSPGFSDDGIISMASPEHAQRLSYMESHLDAMPKGPTSLRDIDPTAANAVDAAALLARQKRRRNRIARWIISPVLLGGTVGGTYGLTQFAKKLDKHDAHRQCENAPSDCKVSNEKKP